MKSRHSLYNLVSMSSLWQAMQPQNDVEEALLENEIGLYALCVEDEGSFRDEPVRFMYLRMVIIQKSKLLNYIHTQKVKSEKIVDDIIKIRYRKGGWRMENVLLITDALEFIEANLTQDIKTDDIAKNLYCSKSYLEKLFRFVTNMSIKDYSLRRRMSCAAKEIIQCQDMSLLDLAIKYGYSSNEAFSRAFVKIWNVTPSEYRKNPVHFELFPALHLEKELMEDEAMKSKKKVDISELYDYIQERRDCYFVGVDIKSLMPINEISRKAGDIAILTALKRLEAACGDDDIVFRIGGDEFVALTNSENKDYTDKIVNEILSHNGEPFKYQEKEIPLSLYVTSYKIEEKTIRYSELFATMQRKLDCIK